MIDVYCGFHRETVVAVYDKIVDMVAFEYPCFECGGRGIWPFGIDGKEICVTCKGTGKQYCGL